MAVKLVDIAAQTESSLSGDGECLIESISDIKHASKGDITFLFNARYAKYLPDTNASAIVISSEYLDSCKIPALVSDNPRLLYARIANILKPEESYEAGISASSVIAEDASVDKSAHVGEGVVIESGAQIKPGAVIGSGCVIEKNAIIGAGTRLRSNATIGYNCSVGENCIIHSGAVIGADGFGFVKDGDSYLKIPQLGSVRIGNNVEIGANTTIDRGAIEDTVIGDGVKLDNQIQIAHSVTIGENTVISAATAIAGSTSIGRQCLIGGCVGIIEHLTITDNVIITGRTMVTRSITEPGSYSSSTPMDTTENWRKNSARFRRLDELAKRVTKLEKASKE